MIPKALLLLPILMATTASYAQSSPGFVVDVHGHNEVTLAVAAPYSPSGDLGGIAETLRRVIEHDLDLTGYFKIQPPNTHLARADAPDPAHYDAAPWKLLKTAALIETRVRPSSDPLCGPDLLCLDMYVYDVFGGKTLAAKRLKAPSDAPRTLAHVAASTALKALTGKSADWFRSLLAAVREVDGHKELALVGLDGEGIRAITRNGSINLSPALSPDGQRVVWTSYRRGEADLYAKTLSSGDVQLLSAQSGAEIGAAVSPDGRTVATAISGKNGTDLWLIDASTGKTLRQLTQGGGIDISPAFSPDGQSLVFASERSGGSQIFIMPTNGGDAQRVTRTSGLFSDPAYHPDGNTIAFVGRVGGRFDIFTIRTDGTALTRITEGMGDNEDPAWSPDGDYLVFSSTRDGRQRLWISTADGRHQRPITQTGGWSQPAWLP